MERFNHHFSEEQQTERFFYSFVTHDIAHSEWATKSGDILYYTGFQDVNNLYNLIVSSIYPSRERTMFTIYKKCHSDLIAIEWKEDNFDKTIVKEAFAQLDVSFLKRGEKYTVVFVRDE
jgi:hypothetical protein